MNTQMQQSNVQDLIANTDKSIKAESNVISMENEIAQAATANIKAINSFESTKKERAIITERLHTLINNKAKLLETMAKAVERLNQLECSIAGLVVAGDILDISPEELFEKVDFEKTINVTQHQIVTSDRFKNEKTSEVKVTSNTKPLRKSKSTSRSNKLFAE